MNDAVPQWRASTPMIYPRLRADFVLLPDGTSVAIGGSIAGRKAHECAVHAAEIWNPDAESWTEVASHTRPSMYHSTAILLLDGRVLAAGSENHDGQEKMRRFTLHPICSRVRAQPSDRYPPLWGTGVRLTCKRQTHRQRLPYH